MPRPPYCRRIAIEPIARRFEPFFRVGIDLDTVDWLVLSHGHYDHGGRLATFFERNSHAPVILRRGARQPFYGSAVPSLPSILHRADLVTR